MPKSPFAKQLASLQGEVNGFLIQAGFKKNGRTYNRITPGDLVQVINFQMGWFPIGEGIPYLRENLCGKFTVNLGVFLPCISRIEDQTPARAFIQENHCSIRDHLGNLAFGKDTWFDLPPDISSLSGTIVQLLGQFGMPFLDTFPDYSAVLAYYDQHETLPFQNEGRATLEAALVSFHLGDEAKSRMLFLKALSTDFDGFRQHVRKLANHIGIRLD